MSERQSFIKSNWLAISILVAHLALGILYSVAVPIWEAYDEPGHYFYVRYIATEHALPRTRLIEWNDETHQPPLYYILGALATFWVDTSDGLKPVENPHSYVGNRGGCNRAVHYDNEAFPYRGTVLAFHLVRLVSVLLSTVTVWLTYLSGRLLFPKHREIALGAMAINAFWPSFLFIGSVVNNDIMVTACGSLTLFFALKFALRGPKPKDFLALVFSVGLGLMSKSNGLALIPFALLCAVVALVGKAKEGEGIIPALRWGLVLLGVVGLVYGWLYLGGGFSLHRNPFGRYRGAISSLASTLLHPISSVKQFHWDSFRFALRVCFVIFVASFGWGNIGVEAGVYRAFALALATASLGLIASLFRDPSYRGKILFLLLNIFFIFAPPAYIVLRYGGFNLPGRYIMPAISAFSLLFSLGSASLAPKRLAKGLVMAATGGLLLIFASLVPFRYISPAYARPPLLSPADVQDLDNPLDLNFGDKMELLGYELDREEVEPGGSVGVTLYWRCIREMKHNYSVAVKVLDQDYRLYGVRNTFPGDGNYATSLWKEGDILRDTYRVPISSSASTPYLAQVSVAVFLYGPALEHLPAFDSEGRPSNTTFGRLIIRSKEQPKIETTMRYELGGKVALVGYEMDGVLDWQESGVRVKLYWLALAEMDKDYTVFVHLLDEEDRIKVQGDSQPMGGNSPTSIWKAGEVIEDEHFMPLPPGEGEGKHRVVVGMYDLATMERLAVFDADGSRLPQDAIVLEKIELPLAPKNIDVFRCFSLDDIQPTPDERLRAYRAELIPWLVDEGIWSLEDALGVISFWIWQGDLDGAELTIEGLLGKFDKEPEVWYNLAQLHRRREECEEAIEALSKAIELDTHYAPAYLEMGQIYEDRWRKQAEGEL